MKARIERLKLRLAFRLMPLVFKMELARALELAWSQAVTRRLSQDHWPDKGEILRMIRLIDGRADE